MVDGEGGGSEGVELVESVLLDWAWFLAGGFEFDEADLVSGEDDEAVWDSGRAGGYEFPAESALGLDGFGEVLFECFFTHGPPARKQHSTAVRMFLSRVAYIAFYGFCF
ncbi:Uncharacterised protein [Trueperella bialowiezensis]|uniref:Uncharacterized protein n=1 Tax=Trueperella bialowiezensis TaxID=312285 RepID=A0A448PE67_9ACTO|nr:Uncharacterised protein [Trueperella bialowiezensis]